MFVLYFFFVYLFREQKNGSPENFPEGELVLEFRKARKKGIPKKIFKTFQTHSTHKKKEKNGLHHSPTESRVQIGAF
jgi:hypothetical protein